MHVVNASGMCMFGSACCDADTLPEFLSAVTGSEYTMDRVVDAGWRIGTVRMAFSTREGNAPAKFKVPGRMLGNPVLTSGPHKDVVVDNVVQNRDYLIAMGWDPETAQPQSDTLQKLGIPASAE